MLRKLMPKPRVSTRARNTKNTQNTQNTQKNKHQNTQKNKATPRPLPRPKPNPKKSRRLPEKGTNNTSNDSPFDIKELEQFAIKNSPSIKFKNASTSPINNSNNLFNYKKLYSVVEKWKKMIGDNIGRISQEITTQDDDQDNKTSFIFTKTADECIDSRTDTDFKEFLLDKIECKIENKKLNECLINDFVNYTRDIIRKNKEYFEETKLIEVRKLLTEIENRKNIDSDFVDKLSKINDVYIFDHMEPRKKEQLKKNREQIELKMLKSELDLEKKKLISLIEKEISKEKLNDKEYFKSVFSNKNKYVFDVFVKNGIVTFNDIINKEIKLIQIRTLTAIIKKMKQGTAFGGNRHS